MNLSSWKQDTFAALPRSVPAVTLFKQGRTKWHCIVPLWSCSIAVCGNKYLILLSLPIMMLLLSLVLMCYFSALWYDLLSVTETFTLFKVPQTASGLKALTFLMCAAGQIYIALPSLCSRVARGSGLYFCAGEEACWSDSVWETDELNWRLLKRNLWQLFLCLFV